MVNKIPSVKKKIRDLKNNVVYYHIFTKKKKINSISFKKKKKYPFH